MKLLTFILTVSCALTAVCFCQERLTGVIQGAKFQVDLPAEPGGRLLMLAHGYRPEGLPVEADVGSSHGLSKKLVADGWAVASTSYRRNGWIMEDAAEDIIQLHDWILRETDFEPSAVYLMGNSMGGGISTWLAEHEPERFDGVLAMGAYLFEPIGASGESSTTLADYYNGLPRIPVLFLTNTSELDGPATYVKLSEGATVPPVLWTIHRDGHVNQNEAEQAAGLMGLVDWVEKGEVVAGRDATIALHPDSTVSFSEGEAIGRALTLVPVYGNFITNFVSADMQALGIEHGDYFQMRTGEHVLRVKLGRTYTDVPVGDWVGFWDAQGYLLICRNYKDAVATLGLKADDRIVVRALDQ